MLERFSLAAARMTILGEQLWRWLAVLVLAFLFYRIFLWLELKIFKRGLSHFASRGWRAAKWMNELEARLLRPLVYILAVWFCASSIIVLAERPLGLLNRAALTAVFLQFAIWADAVVRIEISERSDKFRQQDPSRLSALVAVSALVRAAVWIIVGLLLLDNLGVNVSALVAGLGIGGVAIALAVQSILGDLLCSLSIILDEPFKVGDFIVVDNVMGTVDRIGIRSTRLLSLTGEQVIVSNSDLVRNRVHNFQRMNERRIVFSLSLDYSNSREAFEKAPDLIRQAVESFESTRFDRAHLQRLGTTAAEYEVVFFMLTSDYNRYMDVQQGIYFRILRLFEENEIALFSPSQTLYLARKNAPAGSEPA